MSQRTRPSAPPAQNSVKPRGGARAARAFGGALVLACLGLVGAQAGCSQTPPNTPVRTFERPERIDFVCMRVRDTYNGVLLNPPTPSVLSRCTPLSAEEASDDSRDLREFHLFGLVTQTSRGEVAVADLTGGYVVDHDRETPSINFLTVGGLPRDLAATPDGKQVFVTAAEPNKPALYAIDTSKMLGDWQGPAERTTLATWHSCSLPSQPTSVAVIFDEGLGSQEEAANKAQVAVLLPGIAGNRSKIVTMPVSAFLSNELTPPGELRPCPVTSVVELGSAELVPAKVARGPEWDDGVKYRASVPPLPNTVPFPRGETASEPLFFARECYAGTSRGTPTEVVMTFAEPLGDSRATRFVKDGKRLYVADAGLPLIHVVDMTKPEAPKELAPLVTTSLQDPSRLVTVKDLAISPETREYKRFLYAVDEKKGSLLVYDVTSDDSPHVPLTRPHAQANPFEALDRVELEAPVVAVQFARHESPLPGKPNAAGALCNPTVVNPGYTAPPGTELGLERDLEVNKIDVAGPVRLRGVFALATLTNGKVVTLDVDDWDSSCRRPQDLSRPPNAFTPGQVAQSGTGTTNGPPSSDPYAVPVARTPSTTNEAFFPVSAPHRTRSLYYLTASDTVGRHAPELQPAEPKLTSLAGSTIAAKGTEGFANPKILPTDDLPTQPLGVRFSYEDPTVHVDQEWVTQYEGTIPSLEGALATVDTEDGFRTLSFSAEGAHFCGHGVEDLDVSRDRARTIEEELAARSYPPIARLSDRLVDYVEITDDLLPPTDPYWREDQACWTDDNAPGKGTATSRFNTCNQFFDGDFEPPPEISAEPFPNVNRHFPIVKAFDGKLVVSRFFAAGTEPRTVVPVESSNEKSLALAKCCFHNQAHFRVRTAMQWVTKGSTRDRSPVQFLHHMTRGGNNRCVPSCEARQQLLNARSITVPYPTAGELTAPSRNSSLAMRNPMFSFTIFGGQRTDRLEATPTFGMTFRYTTRGRFEPLSANIAQISTAVNPRSMRYVGPLGQMAIVDGASQGLVLFDLRTVNLSRTTFY